ncbi:MAG: tetratricopeptide repeat protein, partial [Bryobacteraceae bacterium]
LQRSDQLLSLESAIKLLNRALELDPKYALAHSGLGEAYLYQYELTRDPKLMELALQRGDQGLALNPNLAQTNISMGRIHLGTGRYQEARHDFEKATALDSRNNEAYQGLANAYSKLKDDKRAEAIYLQAIALRPGDWTGYKHLGMFYYERSEYDKAIAQYSKVVELSPDNAQGYVNLGVIQALTEKWDEAEKTFLLARSLDPSRVSTITNLAKIYYERGQYDRALEYYQRALDLNNRSYLRWGNLGMTYKRVGNEQKAREAIDRAIQLLQSEILVNPRRGELHSYLGYYRAMLGRPDYREPLQTALQLAPADLGTVARVAEGFAVRGDTARAVELVKQLIAQGYNVKFLQRSLELRGLLEAAGVPAPK